MAAPLVPIKNGDGNVKLRNPVITGVLYFFTLGLYGLYWYYQINRELADLGRARGSSELGDSPMTSLLALFPGGLIIVPAVISMYNTGKRSEAAQRLSAGGQEPSMIAVLVPVLLIFIAPVGAWYTQMELNKLWEREAEPPPQLSGGVPTAPETTPQEPAEAPERPQ